MKSRGNSHVKDVSFFMINERVNIFICDEKEKMFTITCQNIEKRIIHFLELSL